MSGHRFGRKVVWQVPAMTAAALLIAATPAGSDNDPEGYRVHLAITPEAGARVQRVSLPAAVLATLQTEDGHDVRVFDARGRAMPIARSSAPSARRRDRLQPMPILGAPDALKVSGVSLRLDGRGGAQVAELRGAPATIGTAPVLLGVLLDARALTGHADRLLIDADLPEGQPVTLGVAASGDLREWRPLGEATIYRRPGETARPSVVPLDRSAIAQDYLRITWSAGSRLLAPVAIRRVVLETRGDGPLATVPIEGRAPAPTGARVIDFGVPFATRIVSMRVLAAHGDGVVPVRVLGREDREQPWASLGTGLATDGSAREIGLGGSTPRNIRIEADARSQGFSTAPMLRFGLAPRDVVFLASGTAPFTLAAGRADASDPFLAQRDLVDGQGRPGEARVSPGSPMQLTLHPSDDGSALSRSAILWAVLVAATALLAGIAWLLWRQRSPDLDGRLGT